MEKWTKNELDRREIMIRHRRRSFGILGGMVGIFISGLALYYESFAFKENPHGNSPIVVEYNNMRKSLEQLESTRRSLSGEMVGFPYAPEGAQEDLEFIYGTPSEMGMKIERTGKLIDIVTTNMEQFREKNEVIRNYEEWKPYLFRGLGFGAIGLTMVAPIIFGLTMDNINGRKRDKELGLVPQKGTGTP